MSFIMPKYNNIDFSKEPFSSAPDVKIEIVTQRGVAPLNYHATSIYPEYFKINGEWKLNEESRMDCVVVVKDDGSLETKEFRRLEKGDKVILGRTEDGQEGIFINANPFYVEGTSEEVKDQKFSFRTGKSRETSFSRDYDNLYDLLEYEKENGYIVWVLGPAVVFDYDSKIAMQKLIENGFADVIFAGNALATHDVEGSYLGTALGQDIYTQTSNYNGHYHHIDIINMVRSEGSLQKFIENKNIKSGVVYACVKNNVPLVLAGSIRDDGPMPEVISDVYEAQNTMRYHCRKATTVICVATMLHTIATGNMTPIYKIENGNIRPVFIYTVDISEFASNKLRDRGSLEVTSIVTNAQDFVVNVAKNANIMECGRSPL